ncbi:MAG: hypothetical protein ACE5F7_07225 [Nitrospiria bacterium]
MRPLINLWLIVLASSVVLSGFFYLAENYSHIIGNFYFLTGSGLGIYLIIIFFKWLSHKNTKKGMSEE